MPRIPPSLVLLAALAALLGLAGTGAAGPVEVPAVDPPLAPTWCDDQNESNAVNCVTAFVLPLPGGAMLDRHANEARAFAYAHCPWVGACGYLTAAEEAATGTVEAVEQANREVCRHWPIGDIPLLWCRAVGPVDHWLFDVLSSKVGCPLHVVCAS